MSQKTPQNTLHIYIRVSTKSQMEDGVSLESQLEEGIKNKSLSYVGCLKIELTYLSNHEMMLRP